MNAYNLIEQFLPLKTPIYISFEYSGYAFVCYTFIYIVTLHHCLSLFYKHIKLSYEQQLVKCVLWFIVFNATFNNISVVVNLIV